MPYLGKSPQHGNYSKLDDIASGFDGSDATHALASNSVAITPVRPEALIISMNGVIQEPVTDYTVSGTNITFTTAPASGDSFFGVVMGEQLAIGTPSDATVTSAKLSGDLTLPGKLTAAGDTASGDNASLGYTSAEGLILTGQGSTNDITIKNDADTTVMSVPTGGTAVTFAGNVTVNGLIFDNETLDIYDEGTWSPVLRPYTTAFDSITYDSIRLGRYVIIGHTCHFEWAMRTDGITAGSGSGAMNIFGFPVAPHAQSNHYRPYLVDALGNWAGEFPSLMEIHTNQTSGALYYNADTTTAKTALAIADCDTGTDKNWAVCVGQYETD